ncbi:hypothetical protein ACFLX9_00215 [Chloroflexota bacterium]
MRIAIGSDQRTHLTDSVLEELEKRGITDIQVVEDHDGDHN